MLRPNALPPTDILRRNRYRIRPAIDPRHVATAPAVDQVDVASAAPLDEDVHSGCYAVPCQDEAASAAPSDEDLPRGCDATPCQVEAASAAPSYEDLPRGCYATRCQVEAASAAPSYEDVHMGPPSGVTLAFTEALDSGGSASSGGPTDRSLYVPSPFLSGIPDIDSLSRPPFFNGPILEETETDGRWERWHLALLEYFQYMFMRYQLRHTAPIPKRSRPASPPPPTPIQYKRPASERPAPKRVRPAPKMRGSVRMSYSS